MTFCQSTVALYNIFQKVTFATRIGDT